MSWLLRHWMASLASARGLGVLALGLVLGFAHDALGFSKPAALGALADAWSALVGLHVALLTWSAATRDAVEYWTHAPLRGAVVLPVLASAALVGSIGLATGFAVEPWSVGPLGLGLLFFCGTLLWAERRPRTQRDEGRSDRWIALPGALGVAVLALRATLARDDPATFLDRQGPGLLALLLALAAALLWKRGRSTWGTDRLRVRLTSRAPHL